MASPRPQPTRLKQLHGNPGKRPLNKREPRPALAEVTPPSWLDDRGRALWKQLAPEIIRIGILTKADVNAFGRYCGLMGEYLECLEFLKANGSDMISKDEDGTVTGVQPYPQRKRKMEIETLLLRYEQEFGLTPSSRSKLSVAPEAPQDELAEFLPPMKIA